MVDSTNPRIIADNIKELAARDVGSIVEANPTGEATADLEKLGVDGTVYGIPTYQPTGYSTEEVDTGVTWLNGEKIFRKVISVGDLPNATTKSVAAGITNLGIMLKIYGVAYTSGSSAIPLPFVDDAYVAGNILIDYQASGDIRIISGSDKSAFTGYIVLEYTKTASTNSTKRTSKK